MNKRKLAKPFGYSALLILLFLVPLFVTQAYIIHIMILIGINVIMASSLRLINNTGQLSIGHGGMALVGAYAATLLVTKLGFSSWAALPLGGLAAAFLALLVGYPFTRLKGIYFAMITVFLAQIISLVALQWKSLTGGSMGIPNIPHPNPIVIPGLLRFEFTSRVDFYYLALVLVLVTLLVLYAIERSRINITLRSISQAEPLAESVGVNTARFKVLAFSIGSFFAGIAGAFYAPYVTVVTPGAFGFLTSIYVVIYMIVGGRQRFSGPILGAVILTLVPELVRGLKEYQPFIFTAVLFAVIYFMPEGLVGLPGRLRKLGKLRFKRAGN